MAIRPVVRPAQRLYLVTPPLSGPASLPVDFGELLAAAAVAAVLLRLAPADERGLTNAIKALAPTIQGAGAAMLVDGHVELVGRSGADGAHLVDVEALAAALPHLKPDRIAGAGGLESRHDAMLAAERGADYVMFGEPDGAGERPALEALVERIAWWSELFECPCVAYADSAAEVASLAAAGADFIALGPYAFSDPRGLGAALTQAAAHLAAEVSA